MYIIQCIKCILQSDMPEFSGIIINYHERDIQLMCSYCNGSTITRLLYHNQQSFHMPLTQVVHIDNFYVLYIIMNMH